MTTTKKKYGQYFTTNYKYILQDMYIPENIETIIEPFAGNCDLLNFIETDVAVELYDIELYDIDPKNTNTIKQDTLLNPPNYDDKFVLTNPPYLARNKSNDKTLFNIYKVNDLYKCFMMCLINSKCLGGILIVPLNFWSSIRKQDIELRKLFLTKYSINQLNIFEEQVFNDTGYTVCAFQFSRKTTDTITAKIYPSQKIITFELNETNNYIIGGEIYTLRQNTYKITRLTTKNIADKNTNIFVKCIDDQKFNDTGKIQLKYVDNDDIYIDTTPNLSARTFATLVIKPELSIQQQKKLVDEFNLYFNTYREQYHSLFLTNYRENGRKRISFDLVYTIVGYLLERFNQNT
jgi:hypothetical protein